MGVDVMDSLFNLRRYALQRERAMTKLLSAAVIERTTAQGSARSILIILAGLADEDRQIALSMQEIARILDRHYDTARRVVRSLRTDGDLELVTRGGPKHPNVYRISARYIPNGGAA